MKAVRIRRPTLPDHPWIYRSQIAQAEPGTRNGDPVRILGPKDEELGVGLFHGKSRIALRVLTLDPTARIDRGFVTRRIDAAVRLRREVLDLDRRTNAWRVVNSEGDDLSGLVADRYANFLVVQVKCLGMYRLASDALEILNRHFPGSKVVFRRDAAAEKIEGFRVPGPEGPAVVDVQADGIRMRVDLAKGHKTGSFLDQRDNRRLAASLAAGRDVLDLFSYDGGFALACAKAGAKRVRGVDLDEEAVARAVTNAEINGQGIEFRHADAFEVLREKPRTDFLLLDPPKWISSRDDEESGKRKYLDLNTQAVEALNAGALLMTSSCSGRLSAAEFLQLLRQAAARARKSLRILEVRGAAPDHPVTANFPEGRYLTAVLAVVA